MIAKPTQSLVLTMTLEALISPQAPTQDLPSHSLIESLSEDRKDSYGPEAAGLYSQLSTAIANAPQITHKSQMTVLDYTTSKIAPVALRLAEMAPVEREPVLIDIKEWLDRRQSSEAPLSPSEHYALACILGYANSFSSVPQTDTPREANTSRGDDAYLDIALKLHNTDSPFASVYHGSIVALGRAMGPRFAERRTGIETTILTRLDKLLDQLQRYAETGRRSEMETSLINREIQSHYTALTFLVPTSPEAHEQLLTFLDHPVFRTPLAGTNHPYGDSENVLSKTQDIQQAIFCTEGYDVNRAYARLRKSLREEGSSWYRKSATVSGLRLLPPTPMFETERPLIARDCEQILSSAAERLASLPDTAPRFQIHGYQHLLLETFRTIVHLDSGDRRICDAAVRLLSKEAFKAGLATDTIYRNAQSLALSGLQQMMKSPNNLSQKSYRDISQVIEELTPENDTEREQRDFILEVCRKNLGR